MEIPMTLLMVGVGQVIRSIAQLLQKTTMECNEMVGTAKPVTLMICNQLKISVKKQQEEQQCG